MSHRFLFLDSNILLHYIFFAEIDWPKLVNVDTVELVVPYTVIATLDKQKFSSSDAAVRKRAKKVIGRFESISNQENRQVRGKVTLQLLDQEPDVDYGQRGLIRESEDDRIIAEILHYREQHPDKEIAAVTADLGFRLKCKRQRIPLLELPSDYQLPSRPDTETRRVRELEAQLAELRSMLPRLRLSFPDGETRTGFDLVSPTSLSEDQVKSHIENARKTLERPLNAWLLSKEMNPFQGYNIFAATEHDWNRYREEIDEYLEGLKDYLKKEDDYSEYKARVIELTFLLQNDGNGPAEDSDVYIHFDGDFEVLLERNLRDRPKRPSRPKAPPTGRPSDFALPDYNYLLNRPLPALPALELSQNVSAMTVTKTNSEEVHVHVGRIKQQTVLELGTVFILFPSIDRAKSFQIEYTLNSVSLPENVTGTLNIKVQRS